MQWSFNFAAVPCLRLSPGWSNEHLGRSRWDPTCWSRPSKPVQVQQACRFLSNQYPIGQSVNQPGQKWRVSVGSGWLRMAPEKAIKAKHAMDCSLLHLLHSFTLRQCLSNMIQHDPIKACSKNAWHNSASRISRIVNASILEKADMSDLRYADPCPVFRPETSTFVLRTPPACTSFP